MINYEMHAAAESAKRVVHESKMSQSSVVHDAAQSIAATEAAIMQKAEALHADRVAELCRLAPIE